MRQLRADIQVLRAVAVLSVLIFHFELPGLHKGYLGVDIFFVISGYLMSRVIIDEMDEGRFRAGAFYFRRARRLLPAVLVMLTWVTLLAPWTLARSVLHDYAQQLAGSLGFVANIVLWQQSGYFDSQAELKPLLHTWSLALEEQYYFVLPWVLVALRRRARGWGLLGLMLGSLAACQWMIPRDPSGAFYLLPFRAWELLIGSLCALPRVRAWSTRPLRVDSAWVCLPVMLLGLVWGTDDVHPRTDALLVCLSTAGLIVWPSAALQSGRPWMRPWHWVGNQSYSLYLIHWPLVVLARHVWLQGMPAWLPWLLLPLSFALAQGLYLWVEQPWRRVATPGAFGRRLLLMLLPLALAAAWMGWHLQRVRAVDEQAARRPNWGLSPQCDAEALFAPQPACVAGAAPRTLVWGDSFAMHLVPALVASPSFSGVVQATRSACAPVLGLARQVRSDPADRGARCLAFNQSVLRYAQHTPRIRVVVLSARWSYFWDDPLVDANGRAVRLDEASLAQDFTHVIRSLRAAGKQVVVVAPPPSLGPRVDLGMCAERHVQGLVTLMSQTDGACRFAKADADRYQSRVLGWLAQVARMADVAIVSPSAWTCVGGMCEATEGGVPLYRDFGHLSVEGGEALGRRVDLGHILELGAR